ncbi:hypothetical protein ACS5NO_19465 [Larkinella sp. GY13]|uniref:hypothetical protein n=1 Tax=Larkinella sp. GY13 TaxID=3453720 RepID=UPI003EEBFC21
MATANFQIKAISKVEKVVRVRIWIINPDVQYFPERVGFGLQLLWDALEDTQFTPYPLAEAVNEREITDVNWLAREAENYVDQFTYVSFERFPVPESIENLRDKDYNDFWDDLGKVPGATADILLTDSKWARHIQENKVWKSYAFDA